MKTLIFIVAVFAIMGESADWDEDHYEFRKKEFDFERLMIRGDLKYMQRFDTGLMITIPANAVGQTVSIAASRKVVGDCEISASFELLKVPRSSRSGESGVGLEIKSDEQVTGIRLLSNEDGGREYAVYIHPEDDIGSTFTEVLPAATDSLVLKIVREGPVVKYLVSEGASENYRELHAVQFSDLPIRPVRMITQQAGGAAAVKVCWHDLHIRGIIF